MLEKHKAVIKGGKETLNGDEEVLKGDVEVLYENGGGGG